MSPSPASTPLPPLAQLLRQLREEAGLSYGQLAEKAGLSKAVLYRLETGENKTAQVQTLNALALAGC